MFSLLYFGLSLNEVRVCQAGEGALLCYCRDEVAKDTPKGTTIFFVIGNHGQAARRLTLTLDGQPITLEQEPQMDGAHGLTFLQYPYDPARHGLNQTLVIKFESTSGMQDCHTYTLKHGVRHLARMDPP